MGDHRSVLFPSEAAYAACVVRTRALEFATGRMLARVALERMGFPSCEIPRHGRLPAWPASVVGSIAHTRTLAASIVGRATVHAGIGIDIEAQSAVSPEVAQRVLTPAERDWLPAPDWRTMAFSSKEAIYKAAYPLTGEFLGFGDVELDIDAQSCEFRARCRRDFRSAVRVDAGRGYWAVYRAHWLVVFVIPRDAD